METARCSARGNPAGFADTVIGAKIAQEIGLQHQLRPTPSNWPLFTALIFSTCIHAPRFHNCRPRSITPRVYWRDFIAGISVAGVLLPEAVAYAAIAGVPAIHALLAALIGLCVYPFLGTSRFAIVAPTSSAAAVFAASMNSGGVNMGYALVALTGALFLLAGLLRAGFLRRLHFTPGSLRTLRLGAGRHHHAQAVATYRRH